MIPFLISGMDFRILMAKVVTADSYTELVKCSTTNIVLEKQINLALNISE